MKLKLILLAAVLAAGFSARAAGPATNVVTLVWTAPTNSTVPFVYEVQQSSDLILWTVIAPSVPSGTTNMTLQVDKDLKCWRVRSVNATNSAWASDFSNVASTLWPAAGGNLSIQLGP